MRVITYAVIAAVVFGIFCGAQASSHQIRFDLKHFSYHDEKNIVQQMQLAPKVGLRFVGDVSEDEKNEFFAKFTFTNKAKDPKDDSRVFLEFASGKDQHAILKILGEIASSDSAEATPVFLINNMEAIVEGMIIRPKVMLAPDDIERRIKRFGQFKVGTATQQQDEWIFPVTAVKPPLNLFILINLVHEDDWVKRAYPQFRYLQDPIMSRMSISPPSGTIDEPRTLRWTVHIFDPAIAFDEKLLPEFGKGTFVPQAGGKAAPSYFFTAMSERERLDVPNSRGKEMVFSWTFRQYAVGEWTIPPQPFAYAINGVQNKLDTSSATFVVTSLIGQLKIDDMPSPRVLPIPAAKPSAKVNTASLPVLPVYWFDRWSADVLSVVFYATLIMFACLAGALLLVFAQVIVSVKHARKRVAAKERFLVRIDEFCEQAQAQYSYAPLYEAMCAIIVKAFPHLRKHPLLKDIEEDAEMQHVIRGRMWFVLNALFLEFDKMYAKDFAVETSDVQRVSPYIYEVHAFFEPMMKFGEKEEMA